MDWREAYRVFNMGFGMVVVVAAAQIEAVESALTQAGEPSYRVGAVVAGASKEVRL